MNSVPLIHPVTKMINVAQLAAEITDTRNKIIDEKTSIIETFPYLSEHDVRITCYGKLQNVFNSLQLGCAFWGLNLTSEEWWRQFTNYPPEVHASLRSEFQMFLKLGFLQFSFCAVESSFRALMRSIDPGAHIGSTVEFKTIYVDLLLKRLSSPKPAYVELLDMMSKIRNTIHNNGVYFHKNGRNIEQSYKGNTYYFRIGHHIDVGGWPLLLTIMSDLVSMLRDVIRDVNIIGIKDPIIDPSQS